MTVRDILEKIEDLKTIRSDLRTIYIKFNHELTASEENVFNDAIDLIDEYIGELVKKEVKE